jgi:CpeT protein
MKCLRLIILFIGLALPTALNAQVSKELKRVTRMMSGDFSSESQSKVDSSFYDIRLSIIPIWINRSDAAWLYVEQAISSKLDKPYRQRVYKVTQLSDGSFESAVFTLKSPLRFAGNHQLIDKLNPDSLELREGCSVFLKQVSRKKYEGGTGHKSCPSDMRGAMYASSIVTMTPRLLVSWDRGFDRDGKQVWGAEKSGYRFVKIRNR